MRIHGCLWALAALLAGAACEDDGAAWDGTIVIPAQSEGVSLSSPPGRAASGAGVAPLVRPSGDGEFVGARLPALAPFREMRAGTPCGITDGRGVVLSCMPGTYCVADVEGSPGTCRSAPSVRVLVR